MKWLETKGECYQPWNSQISLAPNFAFQTHIKQERGLRVHIILFRENSRAQENIKCMCLATEDKKM